MKTVQPSSEAAAPRLPTDDEIRSAVADLERPIRDYRWLIDEVRRLDVTTDADFQRRYNHFWRVRKNATWRAAYYELLERAKRAGTDFPTALRAMHARTGRIEASFSSKLVATLDPDMPVIDAFVLKFFGLRLPYPYQDDRIGKTIDVYERVAAGIDAIVRSDAMPRVRAAFAERYPTAALSDVKMVDFVLWQVRGERQDRAREAAPSRRSRLSVADAEAGLRELLKRTAKGEAFVITDGDTDVAYLGPVERDEGV